MLRSNSRLKVWGIMSVLKKKRKAAVGRIRRKEGFVSGMKDRMGDGKLIIISITVSGITAT